MEKQNFTKLLLLTSLVSLAGCQQTAINADNNKQVIPENDKTPVQEAAQKGAFIGMTEQDGVKVYEASGSYVSPAATEHLDVKVYLKGDLIENVEMVADSKSPKSLRFQSLFLDGVRQEIVGKKLAEVGEFTRVNGSSLTSTGFNQAIAEIKGAAIE